MMTGDGGQAIVPPDEFSTKTHEQLLGETLAHTGDLVQLLGGEWYDNGSPPGLFDPTSTARWTPDPCDMDGIAEQYSIHVMQVAPVTDPLAKIELVREHWKSMGYKVRQIGPADTSETKFTEIFVDRPFGGGLGFNASTTGMAIWMQSECVKQR